MSIPLFVETRGQGPALALLHGWGLNSGVWAPLTPRLESLFRVTYVDLPGYGRNADNVPQPYTLKTISSMVADVLPNKCSLLGWSLGGLVAQQLAVDHHGSIERLLLVATSPKFAQDDSWPGIKPNVLGAFERELARDYHKTLDRFMAIQAMGSDTAKQDIKSIKRYIRDFDAPSNEALSAGLKILDSTDLRAQISAIACPVHWLFGRLDSLVPSVASEHLQAISPNQPKTIMPHASHAPFISHPEAFLVWLENALLKAC